MAVRGLAFLPLPKERITPGQEKTAYTTSPVFMLRRKAGRVSRVISCFPMKREKTREMVVRLTAMPNVRMAPIIPEATPWSPRVDSDR
jgi:hypothetical protein